MEVCVCMYVCMLCVEGETIPPPSERSITGSRALTACRRYLRDQCVCMRVGIHVGMYECMYVCVGKYVCH